MTTPLNDTLLPTSETDTYFRSVVQAHDKDNLNNIRGSVIDSFEFLPSKSGDITIVVYFLLGFIQ